MESDRKDRACFVIFSDMNKRKALKVLYHFSCFVQRFIPKSAQCVKWNALLFLKTKKRSKIELIVTFWISVVESAKRYLRH